MNITKIMKTDNKLWAENVIGGCAAHNGHLDKLERQAIIFLQSIAIQKQPLFLAYSGGKDSEVILHLAQKAGIDFTPYYRSTSIDRPGTISWVEKHKDIMIMRPQKTFFELIQHRGLPNYFMRFCCDKLKEAFIATNVITGVRRDESWKRAKRYEEPQLCRQYKNGKKGFLYMPILYWTDKDIDAYIERESIKCHPHYYDAEGKFHVERRLGCLACPLRYDRGLADFKKYPRLVKLWCRNLAIYRNTRPTITKTILNFKDEYEHFYHNLYHHKMEELEKKRSDPSGFDPRAELSREFNIELPPAQSEINEITKRHKNATSL